MGQRSFDPREKQSQHLRLPMTAPVSASRIPAVHEDDSLADDRDLVPFFVIVWIASIVRVWGAVTRSETFGAEPTLALLFVLGMPWVLTRALTPLVRRLVGRLGSGIHEGSERSGR
jgi:hypothetical protein